MALLPGLPDELGRECLIRVPFASISSVLSVSKSWKTELRSPAYRRRRGLLGSTRPHFVLALMAWSDPCPTSKTDPTHWILAFDPESESWTRLPPAPRLPFTYQRFCRVAGVGHYVVVVTGGNINDFNIGNIVQVFDLLTGQWRLGAEMPGPGRVKFGLAGDPVSQVVLVAGGESDRYAPIKSTLLYDVAKDTWMPLSDMEKERSECEAVFMGGRFHVINVVGKEGMRTPVCGESLDHDTWQWSPANNVLAGINTEDVYNRHWVTWTEEGDVYSFRPRWGSDMTMRRGGMGPRAVAPLPVELMQVSCMITWKDKLVVIGGPFSSEVMQHDAFVLDLKSYKWKQIHLPEQDSSFANVEWCCGMEL